MVAGELKENMCQEQIDRITSRHIAKLLRRLGETVAPVQTAEIKRQMRFLADDLKSVKNNEVSANEETNEDEVRGNR